MLFELQEVTKTYGAVTALNNLSVTVPPGAIGLLGPNGSGKTTLIRTLLGLINIDRGSGQILGKDIRHEQLDIRRQIGFVPQETFLFSDTIRQNIAFGVQPIMSSRSVSCTMLLPNPAMPMTGWRGRAASRTR